MVLRQRGKRVAGILLVLVLVAALLVPLMAAVSAVEVGDEPASRALPFTISAQVDGRANAQCLLPEPTVLGGFPRSDLCRGPHPACLLVPPSGLSDEVCPGWSAGAAALSRVFRPTEELCGSGDLSESLRNSVAMGVDHPIGTYPVDPAPTSPSDVAPDAVVESVAWCRAAARPIPNAWVQETGATLAWTTVLPGLLQQPGGSIPDGDGGLLHRYPTESPWPTFALSVGGASYGDVDDRPLWTFIGTEGETFGGDWADPLAIHRDMPIGPPSQVVKPNSSNPTMHTWELADASQPGICDPAVDPYVEPHRDDDSDPGTPATDDDGELGDDPLRTWPWSYRRMLHCLFAVDHSGATSVLLDAKTLDPTPLALGGRYDIEYSPRLAWVPETWRDFGTYLPGGSQPAEHRRLRPVFVNDLVWYGINFTSCVVRVGEGRIAVGSSQPCLGSPSSFRTVNTLMLDVDDPGSGAATMLPPSVQFPAPISTDVHISPTPPAALLVGGSAIVQLDVGVTEAGPDAASDVWFDVILPPGLTFGALDVPDLGAVPPSCTAVPPSGSGTVRCDWSGTFDAGSSLDVDVGIDTHPPFGLPLDSATVHVAADSGEWDVDLSNNEHDVPIPITYPNPSVSDVAAGHPFEQSIWWGLWSGTTTGYPDGTFGSARAVTRQAAVTWLWRLAGAPIVACPVEFTDVFEGHPFRDAICWAAASGITTGYPDGSFGAAFVLTRQATVAWLWRLAGSPIVACPVEFTDVSEGHPFRDAICWAAASGITTGYPDGSFGAAFVLTRQASMVFLFRSSPHIGSLTTG